MTDAFKGDEGPTGPRGKRGPIGAVAGLGAVIVKKGGLLVQALTAAINFDTNAFTAAKNASNGSQVDVGLNFGASATQPLNTTAADARYNTFYSPLGHSHTATMTVRSASVGIANNAAGSVTANCVAGEQVTGGGYSVGQPGVYVSQNNPTAGFNLWNCAASNASGATVTLVCYAMCQEQPIT